MADHQKEAMQSYVGPSVTIWNWLRNTQQPMLSKRDARNVLNIPQEVYVFGFVGRVVEAKGIFDLINAFQYTKNVTAKLIVIGDGPDLLQAKQMAKNDRRISFTGFRGDAISMMSAFDCFVMPSHAEAFPLVLIEALNAGCDIISTGTKGAKEMLAGTEIALLPLKNTEAIGKAMVKAASKCNHDRNWSNLKSFDREKQIDRIIRFYRALITHES